MTIHLAGDSTVAPAKPEEDPLTGWGEHLSDYVSDDVRDLAVGGATTGSFVAEGRWDALLEGLHPGDWVLIQFGHNDQKEPHLDACGGYRRNLESFVRDVRARGAEPVLLTSVERRLFEDGRLRRTHGAYPQAVRDLANEQDVHLIDANAFTRWLYEWLGEERSQALFVHLSPGVSPAWPEGVADNTHFSHDGAHAVARFVARSLDGIRRVGEHEPAWGKWKVRP
ncbi:rhamnogalacturonan acetylesterase [Humibacter sp.]|uniref:rhamnogalacturonan acetylesterase n=1 Tax=Humibacter sp. TaxID=1940291 RepID=UPI003F821315